MIAAICNTLDIFRSFPLQNAKDQKSGHVLWEDVFWQLPPYKDTFNNGLWHRGNQHCALQRVSPLSSSVGSQREPRMQCCLRECHLGRGSGGLWLLDSPFWSSLLTFVRKRKSSFFHITLSWSQMWFYMLMVLGNSHIIIIILENISLLPALAEHI